MNHRIHRPALSALTAVGATTAALGIATASAGADARAGVSSTPPKTLNAQTIKARSGTAKAGTVLKSGAIITNRVFSSAANGFALANGPDEAQYPVMTTNGGATWKIAGPALHVDAADAPDAVDAVGVAGKVDFVYGPSVVDVTSDGGSTWYRIYPQGNVTAVVSGERGIAAYVQSTNAKGTVSSTAQYVSTNGGRTWTLSSELSG